MRSQKTRLENLERGVSEKKESRFTHEQKLEMARAMIDGNWEALEGKYSTGVINQLKEMCEKEEDNIG
jgi:hypothetical protein